MPFVRNVRQRKVMKQMYGEDCEPYYAGERGKTANGLTWEYWAVEGNDCSQEYLIQGSDGEWFPCEDGEPNNYGAGEAVCCECDTPLCPDGTCPCCDFSDFCDYEEDEEDD